MLIAKLHRAERSGITYLRVGQDVFRQELKDRLQRIGSPARWLAADQAWQCPLTPAAVIKLGEIARELGEAVQWNDGLQQYADEHLRRSDYEHEVRVAMERVMQARANLDPYVTLMQRNDGSPCPPLWHQTVSYHWSIRVRGLLLAHEMGCISGEAVIKVSRHGKVHPIALADLYEKFNGLPCSHPWRKAGITTCKSLYADGVLRHNRITQVLDKGLQQCLRLRLRSGKSLVCTPDHEIRAPGGWVRADALLVGARVLTNGRRLHGRNNPNWRRGWVLDNDGYRLVSGYQGHPMADHLGRVPKHRLVMARHLGRYLTLDEVVHHRDGDKQNNRIANLELMHKAAHSRLHGKTHAFVNLDGGRAGTGGEIIMVPRVDRVVAVEDAGMRHVYDLVMEDPARNFVADGVIVHNCGKTRSAVDASGGWYRTGQIQPMQATVIGGKPAVCGGVLVVCPKTMLQTWQEELARWQNAHAVQVKGEALRKTRMAGTPTHYHIVNYEALKYVVHNNYDGLIVDESHRCANSSTQTHHVLALAEKAKKKLCLTGTPVSNDLKSLFYQMLIVDGGRALGPSRTAFLEKYFTETRGRGGFFDYEEKDDASTAIAQAVSTSCYFLKKEDCLDLPPKTHTPIYLSMTDEQARYYRQIKSEAVTYIQDATVTVEQASARMMKLLQVCQGFALTDLKDEQQNRVGRHFSDAKTEALMELLTDQLRGRKVIVWTMFQYEQQRLADMLTKAGINFVRIDGTVTSQSERDAAKHRWNTDSSVTVFIRQLSMSEGVTLLGTEDMPCFTTVYLGLTYSMVHLLQSQDRVHRIGQKYACSYIYLLTENGVDRSVYNRLLEKVENANAVQHTGKHYYAQLLADQPDKAA